MWAIRPILSSALDCSYASYGQKTLCLQGLAASHPQNLFGGSFYGMIGTTIKKDETGKTTMVERFELGGMAVGDLCPLNDTDPPLCFQRDLGMAPLQKQAITYVSNPVDPTYWQGLHL
jgi:hypothetical protein